MTKKKTKGRSKSESDAARSIGKSNIKRDGDNTKAEFTGVHVISRQDTEKHFGKTATAKSDRARSQPAANLPKADVHLQLDGRIWQEAEAEAARLGMEKSEYLELALENFKNRPAK